MGRKVRRVPPNWDHPRKDPTEYPYRDGYQPMYDRRFEDRFAEWLADFDRIRSGGLTDFERSVYASDNPLAEWLKGDEPPPDPDYYRPWRDDEATWFQVWETVSEGTPVTPPFATQEELVDYLVEHGDFWQQHRWARGDKFMQPEPPGYSREAAEQFVKGGWAPSMVVVRSADSVRISQGIDALGEISEA